MTHWEYWSVKVVYAPTLILWVLLAIRFRSVHFYKKANPAIKNGGLYGDSKKAIYDILPTDIYPKTVLVKHNEDVNVSQLLEKNGLTYPLIVKPDIGYRGIGVNKVHSLQELTQYKTNTKGDFLIQDYCTLPNEMGLFYCRLPHESKGRITGITLKKFLTVLGNGKESIRDLLEKNPRSAMQIKKLGYQINLAQVLPYGQETCLVPFGNHNRGTAFFDGNTFITPALETYFDSILSKIDGFYYGRLDIRYNTFEELEEGKNFSVIELNGAKSEPTHIYDPKHSLWFGQKEIFRHQFLFCKIIKSVFRRH
jgi:hypothetical protein